MASLLALRRDDVDVERLLRRANTAVAPRARRIRPQIAPPEVSGRQQVGELLQALWICVPWPLRSGLRYTDIPREWPDFISFHLISIDFPWISLDFHGVSRRFKSMRVC